MQWLKLLAALVLFCLGVAVVGSIVGLLLSSLLGQIQALIVLALVVVAVVGGAVLGSGSTRRRENPYW